MKPFKQVRQLAEEHATKITLAEEGDERVGDGYNKPSIVGDSDTNHMDSNKGKDRINFWLKTVTSMNEVYDPHDFMVNLRMKFNMIGYDIDFTKQTDIKEGENRYDVVQFGGVSGMNSDGSYTVSDTSIKDELEGEHDTARMTLCVDVMKTETGYSLHPKLD